jgi:1,4-dihydroxy-2-naphthoate octaprenyltransferase
VLIGAGLAYREGLFAFTPVLFALLGALFIQIGTNFANDYFDAQKGVDTEEREGFTRVTASGLLSEQEVIGGMVGAFGLATLCGIYLAYVGGLPILAVGISGIFLGITYAGGPLPFGSIGLGDLMVFLYFGIFAVAGTYYLQVCYWTPEVFPLSFPVGSITRDSLIAGLPPACLSTCILVVNNVRDLESDLEAGKRTLATMIGYTGSRIEFFLLMLVAYGVPIRLYFKPSYSGWILLPLATVPVAGPILRVIWSDREGETLNHALSRTGQLLFAYSVLFSMGLVL